MFGKIALFELRYQLRNPVLWAALVIFFLLTFGATASPNFTLGGGGNVNVNSPYGILQTQILLSLFYMFVVTAFVANVIIRDDDSDFGPIIRCTRVSKFDYLIGRFTGATLLALIAFSIVPIAVYLGSSMPWLDPEIVGPNRIVWYLRSFGFFAAPTVFLFCAFFFAVATVTRSMMYCYVSCVGFIIIYTAFNRIIPNEPDWRAFASLVDPLAFGPVYDQTKYWTSSELNARLPAFTGTVLANRLLVIGVGFLALVFAFWRFRFADRSTIARNTSERNRGGIAASAPSRVTADSLPRSEPDRAGFLRFVRTVRFEANQVVRSPAFLVLLALGIANSVAALSIGNDLYGTPQIPATFTLIRWLHGSFILIPVVIAIYYGGEAVWRDRDRNVHEIVDATSLPNWAYVIPKMIGVSFVLLSTLLVSILAAMAVQASNGYFDFELGKYLTWYVAPTIVDLVLIAVLSVFVQALSPNKYVGWGFMVLYVAATLTFSDLGLDHPLILYGLIETRPISDMNGNAVAGVLDWWLNLYWSGFAVALVAFASLLWARGADLRLRQRLLQLPQRMASTAGAAAAIGLLTSVGTGAFLYNQMNIQNTYLTQDTRDKRLADYEKVYLQYETLKQPSLTDVTLAIDIWPNDLRMEARGRYKLVNDTGASVETLHVRLPDPDTELLEVEVPGAVLEKDDTRFQHRIYRFETPLAPGEMADLTFASRRWHKALSTTGYGTRLVKNGTFLNNSEFAPKIGMDRHGLLSDRATRRSFGLEPELRAAPLEDASARERNYVGNADWVMSDITVSTNASQVPIAPGGRISDEVRGDRRIARFQSSAPILYFFSVLSADYEVAARELPDFGEDGLRLEVYYDAQHPYNFERMLDAMEVSLGYYSANFGPYQFDHARIIEFPGYVSLAQAFAGTMPWSESFGFLANLADPGKIDYVTYIAAHEMAHQYWAHQLVGADQQGSAVLSETLAQYSALMVMKQLYGEDQIRRFLKYELDTYLNSRGREANEELPLERDENQGYIHYRKGSVVMYLLQDRLGEQRVNAMLAGLLNRYRFKSQPYASSRDVVKGMYALARNDAERDLVHDLLQRITVYDLKAEEAVVRELNDGRFETTLTVAASKFYADGEGTESEAPLNDWIEVGAFTERPGGGVFASENVLLMERRPMTSGKQEVRLVTGRRPVWVGIDPYVKYIDRNSDDNIVAVE